MNWIEALEVVGGVVFGLVVLLWLIYFAFWLVFGYRGSFLDWLLWPSRRSR